MNKLLAWTLVFVAIWLVAVAYLAALVAIAHDLADQPVDTTRVVVSDWESSPLWAVHNNLRRNV